MLRNARRPRWHVVSRRRDGAVLEREGITATVAVRDDVVVVRTGVAAWVRTGQRVARVVGTVLGGVAGAWWVWAQIRRRPRPVDVVAADLTENRQL